ncbi:hypothetical protein HAX54_013393, partial [Datura stramonium]|nr:hypothetical protein [Datura stramonium]
DKIISQYKEVPVDTNVVYSKDESSCSAFLVTNNKDYNEEFLYYAYMIAQGRVSPLTPNFSSFSLEKTPALQCGRNFNLPFPLPCGRLQSKNGVGVVIVMSTSDFEPRNCQE